MVARRPIDDPTSLDMLSAIVSLVKLAISGVRFGAVITYDAAQRVADVQPGRRRRVFGKPVDLPVIKQAPVGWWRFGQMVLVGELQPGDEVLLLTCERELWPWFLQGGQVDPQSERMHDQNDTVVLPWLSSLTRPITQGGPGVFYIGREDGLASVSIAHPPSPTPITTIEGTGPGSIRLGSGATNPATQAVAIGPEVIDAIDAALDAASLAVVPNDGGEAAFLAFATAWDIAKSAINATKTVVE